MSETKNKTSNRRARNFATVVYPDSINTPEEWQDILASNHVPAFISPLHDKDINPGSQEPKKPHFHVLIMFEGVKAKDQAQALIDQIGGVGCEIIESVRGYSRYLCHLDNPEKAQYQIEEVRALSGADYMACIGSALDKYKAIGEMIDYCEENDVVSYSELLLYCRQERFDWFRILCDCGTVVIKEYLKSREWTLHKKDEVHFPL
jgi:hypothetical protein